jgi:hypothetical protein
MQRLVGFAKKMAAIPVEKGAETIIYLASSPGVECISGEYFEDCRIARPSAAARDDEAARRLWEASERIAAL